MTETDTPRPTDAPAYSRVAFQGALGAFSHEACLALRPWDKPIPHATFAEALEALTTGQCDMALIPIENSTIGPVEPAATLVRESGLKVLADVWRPIRHALMGINGARMADLRTVESHPIALAQCAGTLKAMPLKIIEHFDTAGAARDVAEAGDPTRAAIAPVGAAEVYGLSILRNDLQDSSDNQTRFLLLSA
ncbi:prephenate dehydratase domain-containing protein [Brevundimonas sp. SL130]|uniref:prephenate dehydratase domain-containing protein n=1 Tax=Brevundimonas sp. SL130 TaxID=2995143 RepID=UPI00226C78BD|nr:prephenate dehydratase domain-containing protein [Brevundimonas sp. SL130]WAC58587.1 prephenate dehydratase [Brevundimonas sp. SL130]